jgi:hypothetical protein
MMRAHGFMPRHLRIFASELKFAVGAPIDEVLCLQSDRILRFAV